MPTAATGCWRVSACSSGVDGCARCCISCCSQEAAGAFAHLGGGMVNRMPPPIPTDLAPECTSLLATLCLAQAQELTYLKAAADGKSASLLARYTSASGH